MFFSCVYLFHASRELCYELMTHSEESYMLCVCVCLIMCDLETSTVGWHSWPVTPHEKIPNASVEKQIH
jgi:hypothetical protein